MTAAVILAAGSGSRLGGVAKALLVHEGRTFLEHIVDLVRADGGGPCIVVVGAPYGDEVARYARSLPGMGMFTVHNPDPSRGMASSIALGFTYVEPSTRLAGVQAAYLWPVDHPFILPSTLARLREVAIEGTIARPTYRGRGGHPPLIPRAQWAQFASCTDVEGGARGVMSKLRVVDVVVDDPGVVRDVDTSEDRKALT